MGRRKERHSEDPRWTHLWNWRGLGATWAFLGAAERGEWERMSQSIQGRTQRSGRWVTHDDHAPCSHPSRRVCCQLLTAAGTQRDSCGTAHCVESGVKAFPWEPLIIEKDSGWPLTLIFSGMLEWSLGRPSDGTSSKWNPSRGIPWYSLSPMEPSTSSRVPSVGSTWTLGPRMKGNWKGNVLDFYLTSTALSSTPMAPPLNLDSLPLWVLAQPRPGLYTGHRQQSPFHIASLDLAPDIQTQKFYCCLIPPLDV